MPDRLQRATRDDEGEAVLGVLGPVELHDDAGVTIKVGGEKPRAVSPGGATIERVDSGYQLSLPAASIGLHLVEAMVSEGRAALRGGRHERANDLLQRAVDLWRGRPFEGIEAAPFGGRVSAKGPLPSCASSPPSSRPQRSALVRR